MHYAARRCQFVGVTLSWGHKFLVIVNFLMRLGFEGFVSPQDFV